MAEKDFKVVWRKVEAMGLNGQARLDALQVELDKAEEKESTDLVWTTCQRDSFIQIMKDLQVLRSVKGMIYLSFAVMLYMEFGGKNTVEEICAMVACKFDTTREGILREMSRLQKEIYENLTGVRAIVDPTIKEALTIYFNGNEAKIQNTSEFIVSIAKAM